MLLKPETLASLERAGAALLAADTEIKSALPDIAQAVGVSTLTQPWDSGCVSDFENWRSIARASKTLSDIEADFRRICGLSGNLLLEGAGGGNAAPALAAPKLHKSPDATDAVVAARKKPGPKAGAGAGKPTKTKKTALSGNTAKLHAHLATALSRDEYTNLNQSATALEAGIPKGSMAASIAKLMALGYVSKNKAGGFKLK